MSLRLGIAVATWNRARLLGRMLAWLSQVQRPEHVQVSAAVCDNASTDETAKVIEEAASGFPSDFPLRYLHEPTQGKSHALNRLLGHFAPVDWVLFLDDDVKVEPTWLQGYAQGIARYPDAVCLAGPIGLWCDQPLTKRQCWWIKEYAHCFSLLDIQADQPMGMAGPLGYGPNMALKRQAIPAGGFDPACGMFGGRRVAGEDVSIQQAMLRRGGQGRMLADARVEHYWPVDQIRFGRIWKWYEGLGRARVLTHGAMARGIRGRWHYRKLMGQILRAAMRWRPGLNRASSDAILDIAVSLGHFKA